MNKKNYLKFAESESGVYRDGIEIPFKEKILHKPIGEIATSLIITNFNRVNGVREAIDSVLQCVKERGEIEIITVDDGSSDGSVDFLKKLADSGKINFIALKNNSGSEALPKNIAAHFAHGRYISYLDSDDRIGDKDAFDTSLLAMDRSPEFVMSVSNLVFEISCSREQILANMPWLLDVDKYEPSSPIRNPKALEYRRRIAKEHTVYELLNHGYYDAFKLMRRQTFMETGGVVEDIRSCGDFGTYLRLNRHGRTLPIQRDFYVYSIDGNNDSFYSEEYRQFQEKQQRQFALNEIRIRGLRYNELILNCQQEFWDRYGFTKEEVEDSSVDRKSENCNPSSSK